MLGAKCAGVYACVNTGTVTADPVNSDGTLTCADEDAVIRYTLDGSDPVSYTHLTPGIVHGPQKARVHDIVGVENTDGIMLALGAQCGNHLTQHIALAVHRERCV